MQMPYHHLAWKDEYGRIVVKTYTNSEWLELFNEKQRADLDAGNIISLYDEMVVKMDALAATAFDKAEGK